MKHKSFKSFVSVMLVLCMVIGVCPVIAFAEETKTINYVSLGESMTNGYGYDAYREGKTGEVNGFRQKDVTTSYAYMLSEYLKELNPGCNVDWEALAVSCMRPEDLNFLLRFDTSDDSLMATTAKSIMNDGDTIVKWNEGGVKELWQSVFTDNGKVIGDYFTYDEFVSARFKDWGCFHADEANYPWRTNGTLAYARYFQNAVKDADVISIASGNANFGVIMLYNIMGSLGTSFGTFRDAVPVDEILEANVDARLLPYVKQALNKVNTAAVQYLANVNIEAEAAEEILRTLEFTVASYVASYIDMLFAIDEVNEKDSLDIIMLGLMNTMEGVKIDVGEGEILDLGEMINAVTDSLSAFMFALPVAMQEIDGQFENVNFYVAPNDCDVEIIVEQMADMYESEDSTVIRDRIIETTCDTVFGLINSAAGANVLGTITLDDVKAYEGIKAGDMTGAARMTGSTPLACAIYCAFEKAIVDASKLDTLVLDDILVLAGGNEALYSVFAPLIGIIQSGASATGLADIIAVETQLSQALANEKSFESLLNLLARMVVGHGIGSHPTENGHKEIFKTVKAVYPNVPALTKLTDMAEEFALAVFDLCVEYKEEALEYALNFATRQGWITEAQAVEIGKQITLAADAIANGDKDAAMFSCKLLAQMVYKYVDENGHVSQLINDFIGKLKAEYASLKAMTKQELKKAEEKLLTYINGKKAEYMTLAYKATHTGYVRDENSYYVALGGDTLYGIGISRDDSTYYDLLKTELNVNSKSLAQKKLSPDGLLDYVIANAAEIIKADFITYQADASAFVLAALSQEDADWGKYLTEDELCFIQEAIPVIRQILTDDWTKYEASDVVTLAAQIKDAVIAGVSAAAKKLYGANSEKFDQIIEICVTEVKTFVSYIKGEVLTSAQTVLQNMDTVDKLFAYVENELNTNWSAYANKTVAEILTEVKPIIVEKLNAAAEYSLAKAPELDSYIKYCVEKIVAVHSEVDKVIATVSANLNDTEKAFASNAIYTVYTFVAEKWPELSGLDVDGLHNYVNGNLLEFIKAQSPELVAEIAKLGEAKANEILTLCAEKLFAGIKSGTEYATVILNTLNEKYKEIVVKVMPKVVEAIVTELTTLENLDSAALIAKVKETALAGLTELNEFASENEEAFNTVIALCVERVRPMIASAENVKEEILTAINGLQQFAPVAEKILYACVAYAIDNVKAIEAIKKINPDATIIAVGMYNPLQGVNLIANGETIDFGAYVGKFIEATDAYNTALAVANGGYTFVAIPETEIVGVEGTIDLDKTDIQTLGRILLNLYEGMNANAEGHEYIFNQIMGALVKVVFAPSDITLDKTELTLTAGKSAKLTATVMPEDATYKTATWTSSDPTVATVDENGNVTALRMGTATIVARTADGKLTATCNVKVLCTMGEDCPISKFTDVDKTLYWHDGIHYCVENDLMIGISDTEFAPDDEMTRAMLVTILWRISGSPVTNFKMTFKDVEEDTWYTEAVRWAQSTGLVKGYNDEQFAPEDSITREQAATLLYRFAEYNKDNTTELADISSFADVNDISDYALDAIKWANKVGVMIGTTENTFAPLHTATRGEVAVMIYRFLMWELTVE